MVLHFKQFERQMELDELNEQGSDHAYVRDTDQVLDQREDQIINVEKNATKYDHCDLA